MPALFLASWERGMRLDACARSGRGAKGEEGCLSCLGGGGCVGCVTLVWACQVAYERGVRAVASVEGVGGRDLGRGRRCEGGREGGPVDHAWGVWS